MVLGCMSSSIGLGLYSNGYNLTLGPISRSVSPSGVAWIIKSTVEGSPDLAAGVLKVMSGLL